MLDETRPSDRLDEESPKDAFIGELNRLYHAIVELQEAREKPAEPSNADPVEMLRAVSESRAETTSQWFRERQFAIIAAIEAEREYRELIVALDIYSGDKGYVHPIPHADAVVEAGRMRIAAMGFDELKGQLTAEKRAHGETKAARDSLLEGVTALREALEEHETTITDLRAKLAETERERKLDQAAMVKAHEAECELNREIAQLRARSSDGQLREAIAKFAFELEHTEEWAASEIAGEVLRDVLAAHPASEPEVDGVAQDTVRRALVAERIALQARVDKAAGMLRRFSSEMVPAGSASRFYDSVELLVSDVLATLTSPSAETEAGDASE